MGRGGGEDTTVCFVLNIASVVYMTTASYCPVRAEDCKDGACEMDWDEEGKGEGRICPCSGDGEEHPFWPHSAQATAVFRRNDGPWQPKLLSLEVPSKAL